MNAFGKRNGGRLEPISWLVPYFLKLRNVISSSDTVSLAEAAYELVSPIMNSACVQMAKLNETHLSTSSPRHQAHPQPLTISPRIQARLSHGELTPDQVDNFSLFLQRVDREFMQHPIITNNKYTRWFSHGQASDEQLRHFIRQFSVFSNQFLVAALYKVINAPTLQQSRASREILLNELGVIYRKTSKNREAETKDGNHLDKDQDGDPRFVSTEGTVDGGICRFGAAHFEWLTKVAQGIGLGYGEIGKRRHGRETTLYFCDELHALYGSDDPQIAEGASFAVENWASAGFWEELVDGFVKIKENRLKDLKLAFFTWHSRVEAQHALHTLEELEAVYFEEGFDQDKFFQGGKKILDAIRVFWEGLENDRMNNVYQ